MIDPKVSYDLFAILNFVSTDQGGIKNAFPCPVFSFFYDIGASPIGAAFCIRDADCVHPGDQGLEVRLKSWNPSFLDGVKQGDCIHVVYADRLIGSGVVVSVIGMSTPGEYSFDDWPTDGCI